MGLTDPTKDNFLKEIESRIYTYEEVLTEAKTDNPFPSRELGDHILKCEGATNELKSLKQYVLTFFSEKSHSNTGHLTRIIEVRKQVRCSLREARTALANNEDDVDLAVSWFKAQFRLED